MQCVHLSSPPSTPLSISLKMQCVHLSSPLSTPLSISLKMQNVHLSSPLSFAKINFSWHARCQQSTIICIKVTSTRIMTSTSTRHIIHYGYNFHNYANKRNIFIFLLHTHDNARRILLVYLTDKPSGISKIGNLGATTSATHVITPRRQHQFHNEFHLERKRSHCHFVGNGCVK